MKVGDLVKHTGASGWWQLEGKIGVLIERIEDNGMVDTQKHRWHVEWCSANVPRFYRDLLCWPEHLEVVIKKNKKNT